MAVTRIKVINDLTELRDRLESERGRASALVYRLRKRIAEIQARIDTLMDPKTRVEWDEHNETVRVWNGEVVNGHGTESSQ